MGWTFPWASSFGSDFNFDFDASNTEEEQRSGAVHYNYESLDFRPILEADDKGAVGEFAALCGTDAATYMRESPPYDYLPDKAESVRPVLRRFVEAMLAPS